MTTKFSLTRMAIRPMGIAATALSLIAPAALAQGQTQGQTTAQITQVAARVPATLPDARVQVTAFQQAVAEAAAKDRQLAAFYRERGFNPIWTGAGDEFAARRRALLSALSRADDHGLPEASYEIPRMIEAMRAADTDRKRGAVDVAMSRLFLRFASDLQTGLLEPSKVVPNIVRDVPRRDAITYLSGITGPDPESYVETLAPRSAEYSRLMKEKLRLEGLIARGGFGASIRTSKIKPGANGKQVVELRNRLMAMGYLGRRVDMNYDGEMQAAVQQFQIDHGLPADGVAGAATVKEMNVPARDRLKSVIVAMERERWLNQNRGDRHVWVNLTEFKARIIDNGKVHFETRAVIGKNQDGRRSPEFSDVMEHMVINPTWNVPRSIATKEYLPLLRSNPHAVSHINVVDGRGRVVKRGSVSFAQYTAKNFPFDLKQPPSSKNALGLVKFMFPNRNNIYLHDTPAKSLFQRDMRAFSHGCIRLQQPFDFAYTLLAYQSEAPEKLFKAKLNSGKETQVNLIRGLPVHIVYRTAFSQAKGGMNYRADVYGRDKKIWNALEREGVELRGVQG